MASLVPQIQSVRLRKWPRSDDFALIYYNQVSASDTVGRRASVIVCRRSFILSASSDLSPNFSRNYHYLVLTA